MSKLKVLSLFSGIGAFEKALINLEIPFDLINFCEFDKYAAQSYQLLYNVPSNLNLGDVTKVDPKNIEDFNLMTYGFPCQSFSIAGNKLGFEDETRGNLFFESMRIVKEKKPKYLIAENVKGLVGHNKGHTFSTVLNCLEELGYNNYYEVLKSTDFDLPHSRERVFIVSIRKDVDDCKFTFPKGSPTKKTVADILDENNTERYLKKSLVKYLDPKYHTTYNSKNNVIKLFDGNVQGYFNSDYSGKRLYSIHGVCPTLTTKKEAACFVEIESELNAKERFRLQGFDDSDYDKVKDKVSKAQLIKQTGNSISVTVVQAILKNLFS